MIMMRPIAAMITLTLGLILMVPTTIPAQDGKPSTVNPTLKIRIAQVFVEDQAKALDFYTNVLGFVKKHDVPVGEFRWLTVVASEEPDGAELLLEPNGNPAARSYQESIYEQGIPLTAFAVDDVELEYERLVSLGVKFRTKPTIAGTTRIAVLDDTNGNLIQLYQVITRPDLSKRPFGLKTERMMSAPPDVLFDAWTSDAFSRWFAIPGTVLMKPEVNSLFFFESHFEDERHPHYGRFLRIEPDRFIEMTWLTAEGTKGAETVLTIELIPHGSGTHLKLSHEGFPDEESMKGHEQAWPLGLEQLDKAFPPSP